MLMQENNASLVIHHVVTAMVGVPAPAQNAGAKMTDSCYFYTRVSARLLVQMAFLEKLVARNANLVMPLVAAVLVLCHLSARLAVRECFCLALLLDYVSHTVLKVSHNFVYVK